MGARNLRPVVLLVSVLSVLSAIGLAQTVVNNRGFEEGTDPGEAAVLPPGSKAIEGWTVVDGSVSYVGRRWQHAQGQRSISLPCGGGISQTLDTQPGQDYEVRFSMAGDPTATPPLKTVVVLFGNTKREFTFDTTGRSLTEMGWESRTWVFEATDRTSTFTFLSPKAACSVPAVDNIRLEAVEIGVRIAPDGRTPIWRPAAPVPPGAGSD